jgi:hypothetical protein
MKAIYVQAALLCAASPWDGGVHDANLAPYAHLPWYGLSHTVPGSAAQGAIQ